MIALHYVFRFSKEKNLSRKTYTECNSKGFKVHVHCFCLDFL